MYRIKPQPKQKKRHGFTLLEMLIVLGIILVIAAMVVPNLLGSQKKANIKATSASIHNLEQAFKLYAADNNGEYPQGGQEQIQLLLSETDADGKAIDPFLESIPLDAWGQTFQYEYPNNKAKSTKPAIWSLGPNQQDENGSGDDVNNWDQTK
ncbi:MAG: type II secretion system protein GspG [Planctomycetes bacterium]|nr:type II secretion system protein GspG [Planctomycetota bacterium]MCH9724879.1 type II secretion system protein GspG [Planctomycetota bacterium]MCH9776838.1 type II secretion system protein GspG [Planctomycetota bacterium]MCH9791152.1 type II secretion system protein GspG [Planctomycetota bacterium]MDF1743682.1 type II secretion system protein GspG [Gimesia sp.]